MRIIFLGTGEFGVPALRALLRAGHQVVAVVSQPDRPAGRNRQVRPTSIHAAADALGLRHVQAEDVNRLDMADVFGAAEIGVVAAFGQKIGPQILSALPFGCVNIHASLLPKYRGAAPVQWAIINGETTTGVTVFQLDQRWDAGPIWAARATPIQDTETADELLHRLAELGAELIVQTLPIIQSRTVAPQPQDPSQVTRAPALRKVDGAVDWGQPAAQVARRINGLWSWPGAACTFVSRTGKRERVLLARATVADLDTLPSVPDPQSGLPVSGRFPPGAFCDDLTVQTGRGRVRLLEVQPAGKKLMTFQAFANGRHVAPPDRLLPPDMP